MKIIFAGTPDISATVLQSLLTTEHKVIAVYTQPDRPKGRGKKLTASPVKVLAQENDIPVYQPNTLKSEETQIELSELNADLMIVVAYGLILPQAILEAPTYGCWNIHVSLLPRWRGAAPIQRAIEAGDTETGVCIMQMDAGLDTGDILLQKTCKIKNDDTSQTLHDRLAGLVASALLQALKQIDQLKPKTQETLGVTYAEKISKAEAKINWQESVEVIERKIRAYNPWPIAQTEFNSQVVRIWQASVLSNESVNQAPGTIVKLDKNSLDIATGQGILRLTQIQLPGKKTLMIQDILNAHKQPFLVGQIFS